MQQAMLMTETTPTTMAIGMKRLLTSDSDSP
jgi:hypothetical protein